MCKVILPWLLVSCLHHRYNLAAVCFMHAVGAAALKAYDSDLARQSLSLFQVGCCC